MKRVLTSFFTFISFFVFAQEDVKDSKDYHLLDRLPNYYISDYKETEFDSENFFIDNKSQKKEGYKYKIVYTHIDQYNPDIKFPSRLQVLRNYSNAIKKAGGRVIFERYNYEHGHYSFEFNGKTVWIEVKPEGRYYILNIIEEQAMRQDIVIDEELIKNKLELEGKIAIYGIYFDTGKATVKEESKPALDQIAAFLKNNPTVNCWVVGHTDSDGSFEVNSKLSLERARAIKRELEAKYNISTKRLFAEGVGPLAPIATNLTKEGKKLNRRVELVKK